jgi:hypothetical protein
MSRALHPFYLGNLIYPSCGRAQARLGRRVSLPGAPTQAIAGPAETGINADTGDAGDGKAGQPSTIGESQDKLEL